MKKILVVDDDRFLVSSLEKKLKIAGFEVDVAYDGQEALRKVDREKPDLILLDLIMPVMDGITFLRGLKASPETKDIAVILLTNVDYDDQKVTEALDAGVTDYLVKVDYSLDKVIRVVKTKLNLPLDKE